MNDHEPADPKILKRLFEAVGSNKLALLYSPRSFQYLCVNKIAFDSTYIT